VKEICENFLGIDPAEQMIAVRPAQHYTMGGVRTDATGQSPTLKGLFAAGEAACWDMHGFNRLGGNSVAETVVAGMIVGEFVADFCDAARNDTPVPMGLVQHFVKAEQARLNLLMTGGGGEDASVLRGAMQDIMTSKVGIFRTGEALASAVSELQALLERSRHIGLRSSQPGANPELVTAYRTQKMLKLALCVAYGAAVRTESRGAHFREDYPRRDDAGWLKRTLATWPGRFDTLPTLNYEALDVKAMELPPGWRGYGAKDYLEHPDTPVRAAEVAATREQMKGASRHDVQQALMPYQHLLPEPLRGRNQRVDEPL
jgi:fumarate reductase flavoprotein subunit